MIKSRLNFSGRTDENVSATTLSSLKEEEVEWEMRPGGMLVQKRSDNSDIPVPNLRVRVTYGALRCEISVNPRATFGEMKKLLIAETGLQPGEQKLIFRGKERGNGEYLDICGVKDRSKIILMDDPITKERRFIEMRKNSKIQAVQRAISDMSMEVDKLAEQVSVIEKSITSGNKVAEVQITTLTEMLMRQAVKLDSVSAEGDACAQKNLQLHPTPPHRRLTENRALKNLVGGCQNFRRSGKRVQKCVETLDVLKVSNARVKPVVVTTKWETFDPPPPSTTTHWEFFD